MINNPTLLSSDAPAGNIESELVGTLVAGRYRILELIGEGGMGAVFRAEHVHMKKAVALKVLHREMTAMPEAVKRFRREAVASARITHPNVVGATDFGTLPDGSHYLVLDYVSGRTLTEVLAAEGPLPPERALQIIGQVVMALAAAHDAGVIHRDLKPDNVMLLDRDGADFVKVLDFGIAKLETRSTGNTVQLTRAGTVFGTPEYMSPEQAAGNAADQRADLYSVGVILYEMLSGTPPFQGDQLLAVLTAQLTEIPKPLSEQLPSRLREVVFKLLAKDPVERFQDAHQLLAALGPQLAVKSIAPRGLAFPKAFDAWALGRKLSSGTWFGDWQVRTWQLGLAAFLLGALGVGALIGAVPTEPPPTEAATPQPSVAVSVNARDLELAALGNRQALAQLERTAESERSSDVWQAIALGRFRLHEPALALAALEQLLKRAPERATDPELQSWVFDAASSREHGRRALELAAKHMGPSGADLLYQLMTDPHSALPGRSKQGSVLRKASKNNDETARLSSSALRKASRRAFTQAQPHTSPALSVVLELQSAKGCQAAKLLLPRATEQGDARVLPELRRRTRRQGCGLLRLSDCYPCLRADGALSAAIKAVARRAAPRVKLPLE